MKNLIHKAGLFAILAGVSLLPGITVGSPIPGSSGQTNVADYTFEDNAVFTADVSGHGNGIAWDASYGGGAYYITNVPAAGHYALFFYNNGGAGAGWLGPNTNLLATLAGSFSVSLWLKTTQVSGSDTDDGTYNNAGIVSAFYGLPNFVIPMSLTGGKLAFVTGGGTQDTLHSATSINTGQYVHVVVTRDQETGQKNIYVNGALDASDAAGTDLLNGPNELDIGYQNGNGFDGEMDEIQIYSGVLSASEVAYLYHNPGTNVADVTSSRQDFNVALGTTNLDWTTNGDTSWFVENNNTNTGAPFAVQSGSVTDTQASTISVTVTGPETVTFYWSSIANDPNQGFDYQFDLDGTDLSDLYGDNPWSQAGPFTIPTGQHTLSWTVYPNGDTDPTQAGYLDEVQFTAVPVVQATASPTIGAVPLAVRFAAPAVDNLGNAITNWSWNFGDGAVSSAQNPEHTYTNADTFSPSLATVNARGAAPVVIGPDMITVTNPTITVTASPRSGSEPLTVLFASPSVDSVSNTVTSWNWNFGDVGTSKEQNPVHTYHYSTGSYSPSLTVQSAPGVFPVVTGPGAITVTVPQIVATANPRSGTEPLTVQFSSPNTDNAGNTVTSWNWDFGDGATSTAQSPVHTYGNLGTFSPSLAVQNAAGRSPAVIGPGAISVTLSQSAFLTNLPGSPADFTFHNFANAKSVQFNGSAATASNSDGTVLELTKAGSAQTGSAFSSNPLMFTHNVGFSTFFVFRLGNPGAGTPGDGIAFTIHGDSPLALGNGGAGDFGINHSLNVEFDAFKSGTQSTVSGGINANQVAINTNGAAGYLVSVPVTTNLNNGNLWYAWIDYEGVSQDLQVRLSQIPARPPAPTLDTTVNLPGILGITNASATNQALTGNLLVNGDFENEPNWGGGVYYFPGSVTALVSNEIPGWTIEPNHAVTIHLTGGIDPTISGEFSVNPDGEGYDGNNGNFYQDFANNANASYTLSFNWQSWGYSLATPTTSKQEVSVEDTVTGAILFDGLYAYDGTGPHPVHAVTANFPGTGNPLRLRIQESPQSGYNDNTFIMDNFSVTGPPKYVKAYVGFTGAGENQQDILAWKFTALPATRQTGNFNATNLPPSLKINKGIVLARHVYVVAGVIYTNYNYVPITMASNSNAQIAFASGIAELNPASALPNPNAIEIALSNNAAALDSFDTLQYAMLASYTNSGSGGGEGAVINYDNPDYIQFAPYYADNGFPPFNMDEQTYNTEQDQVAANPPPSLSPPNDLAQLQIDSPTFPGPDEPQWISELPDGDIQGDSVSYSSGTPLGTMTARQQVVENPPGPLIISSPHSDGTNFVFTFGTTLNQSYTVWANSNLATTNWVSFTNLSGDGYFQAITIPLTNSPQNFYELSSP
jgi:PKD repeat protein